MEYLSFIAQKRNIKYYIKHTDNGKEYYREETIKTSYGCDIKPRIITREEFIKEIKPIVIDVWRYV